jgi:chorismate mutase
MFAIRRLNGAEIAGVVYVFRRKAKRTGAERSRSKRIKGSVLGRSEPGQNMDIAEWRKKIDALDQQLVKLLSERARAAHEIGKLKRDARMPIYEPDRERTVFDNVTRVNPGPLPNRDLMRIYERIMDIMRQIQQEEIAPEASSAISSGDTEIDSEVND